MSEELLIRYCSPTLAGMKTGNMFACSFPDKTQMNECVRCWNRLLAKKGLRVLPLRFQNERALIYVYRPSRLSADLQDDTAKQLLKERGYCTDTSERCLVHLIKRLCQYEEFPHEIGLFLGYPPEDVRGFIENKADNFKCVGTWKVYGDAEKAQKTFMLYRKCESVYRRQWSHGKTIEQLTVAV